MKLQFEHDYQNKVMHQSFDESALIDDASAVREWRKVWMEALSGWHSPYKLFVDCSQLKVVDDPKVVEELQRLVKFFKGFFLRKVVGFSAVSEASHSLLPFEVYTDKVLAAEKLGIRPPKERQPGDFRSTIQILNHFRQHSVEIIFDEPVVINDKHKVEILKSKLMNNLMQWHSAWNLIIDCSNLEITEEAKAEFQKILNFFEKLFLKRTIGYGPRASKTSYPFEVFRSRHRAAAILEGEGASSGDEADCRSRQPATNSDAEASTEPSKTID